MYDHDFWFVPYCDEHGQVSGLYSSSLPASLVVARVLGYKELHVVLFASDESTAVRFGVIRLIDGDVVYYGDCFALKWIDPTREYIDSCFPSFEDDFLYSHDGFDDAIVLHRFVDLIPFDDFGDPIFEGDY